MRPTTRTPSRALPALLAAAVVSIVLGIVGMHALNTHDVMNNTDHATMTSSMTGAHADMSAGPVTTDPAGVTATVSTTVPDGGNGHNMGSIVMLCLAMLAATAGALLLLTLGLRRMPRVWAHLPTAPTTVTRWVTARLGTGPPPVWKFSVIRC
jgi:hypothetical protein